MHLTVICMYKTVIYMYMFACDIHDYMDMLRVVYTQGNLFEIPSK